jgi:hypothetical protein
MIERNDAATQSVAAENENLAMKVSPQAQIHAAAADRSGGTLLTESRIQAWEGGPRLRGVGTAASTAA